MGIRFLLNSLIFLSGIARLLLSEKLFADNPFTVLRPELALKYGDIRTHGYFS